MGYSFRLTARVLLYAPSHRQDSTYHRLCYTTQMVREKRLKIKERFLFNDAVNTFYLRLYGVRHMVKDHSDSERGNPLRHMGYSFRLTARVLLYAPIYNANSRYHSLCTVQDGTTNSSIGPPWETDPPSCISFLTLTKNLE